MIRCRPASATAIRPSPRTSASHGERSPEAEDAAFAIGQGDGHEVPGDGVADQQAFTIESNPLRLVEAAELLEHGAVEIADEDPVVAGVGDRETAGAV